MSAHKIFILSFILLIGVCSCEEEDPIVQTESVEIIGSTEVKVGETISLAVVVLPENASDKSVIWSILNQGSNASVDQNGIVTALSAGTVTVAATSSDGQSFNSIVITVTE